MFSRRFRSVFEAFFGSRGLSGVLGSFGGVFWSVLQHFRLSFWCFQSVFCVFEAFSFFEGVLERRFRSVFLFSRRFLELSVLVFEFLALLKCFLVFLKAFPKAFSSVSLKRFWEFLSFFGSRLFSKRFRSVFEAQVGRFGLFLDAQKWTTLAPNLQFDDFGLQPPTQGSFVCKGFWLVFVNGSNHKLLTSSGC